MLDLQRASKFCGEQALNVDIHLGRGSFEKLEAPWRALEEHCAEFTVFQSWDWCDAWLREYGQGTEPAIISLSEQGEMLALAPLLRYRVLRGSPIRKAVFIGTGPGDYGGFLTDDDFEEGRAELLVEAAANLDCHLVDLHQLSGETAAVLSRIGGKKFKVAVLPQEPTLAVDLREGFENYWSTLSKKFRSNVAYAERRLKREFKYEESSIDKPDTAASAMESVFSLHQQRWLSQRLPGLFIGRRNRRFHLDLAGRLALTGRLALSLASVDGAPAAAFYGFKAGRSFSYYLGGLDPKLARYSVSTVLIYNLIKSAAASGFVSFDFLRGVEPYKLRWGASVKPIYRLLLFTPGPLGYLAAKLAMAENKFVQTARTRLHR